MGSPTDEETTVSALRKVISRFVRGRGWERFHNPKNLAESICIEASELLELFQWLTTAESKNLNKDPANLRLLSSELADVLIYCFALANAVRVRCVGLSPLQAQRELKIPNIQLQGKICESLQIDRQKNLLISLE